MRILITIQLLFCLWFPGVAQKNFWHVLAEVRFETKMDATGTYEIEVPVFNDHLKSFQNRRVKLKGYIIPLSELGGQSKFMFSSLPFSMCYFCGSAGPETIVEIESTVKIKFTTRPVEIEGTLILNATDPDHHMYILKSANLIDE